MADISLQGICKHYPNGFQAVKSLDLHIQDGEFLVLVGPSGCGKSTTLRMIAGLEDMSGGTLRIGERVVNELGPGERDIAMVFQSYALYPHMSVRQNMGFALKLAGVAKDEIRRRVDEAAQMLHLDPWLERKPKELSGGQRQRVALGRAIVRKPQAFLMDEPLSNLDAKLRVEMRASISRLHRQLGTTTVYVTHDQVEAMTMGSRIVVMKDGVVQQIADPLGLYAQPANRFVASFIGSPAMSFLEGTVEPGGLVRGEGFALRPGGELAPRLAAYGSAGLCIGLRPEHLRLADAAAPADNRIQAVVELVEPLGAETIVTASVGGRQRLVARLAPEVQLQAGDGIELMADLQRLHCFDLASERNLRCH